MKNSTNQLHYQMFPRAVAPNEGLQKVIGCFAKHYSEICSPAHNLNSNAVLKAVSSELTAAGFDVEKGKHGSEKLKVPVLYSLNNHIEKFFDADAVSFSDRIVLEVEAGRAIDNNQFLKDIFQASMMYGIDYLAIAVRNDYRGKDDFSRIFNFLETLYINGRLQLPLKGILLIGY